MKVTICSGRGVLLLAVVLAARGSSQSTTAREQVRRGVIDLVIGGAEQVSDDYLFGNVSGLFLDSLGNIFVGDAGFSNIRVYTAKGQLSKTIGRKGDGPGEFQGPCCFAFDTRGLLWVRDYRSNRYTAFDLTRDITRVVSIIRMPFPSGVPISFPAWDRSGNLIHVARSQVGARSLLRSFLSASGDVVREVPVPMPVVERRVQTLTKKVPGGRDQQVEISAPFPSIGLYAFSRTGEYLLGNTDRYEVGWYSADGQKLRTLRQTYVGPKLSAEERKTEENKLDSQAKQLRVPRSYIKVQVPRSKPPLEFFGFDLEGRVWVRLSVPLGAPNRAHLYSATGQFLGTMEWPAHVTLYQFAARGNLAVGIAKDEDDVLTVVRMMFRP